MGCSKECACNDSLPSKSLFSSIDMDKVCAINEKVKGSCVNILSKSASIRDIDMATSAHSNDATGLVVKIPFVCKVSLCRIEICTSFKKMELFVNNQYVTLSYKSKTKEEYMLPGSRHIIPIVIPAYKHKSVDTLTLRLTECDGAGYLAYLCVCGIVTGALPKAVDATYELYALPENVKKKTPQEGANARIE
ncbi:uncharacterized protein NEMAJ01_2113 [Nematocida major]|uniref:uncharacterized protein n=1 Tax=Nematocida major TaxID=1912982 RepID=UPI0020089AA3|nr:uncharacterized protein NEMAJ01_2113 [Nematocida major]KAH9387217.1 hypothetical protein NEMAJ01_2113 [Nematocida major]